MGTIKLAIFVYKCVLLSGLTVVALSCVLAGAAGQPYVKLPALELGMDRSNMGTEWTLGPPGLPNKYPFNGPYNGPGVFEARRTAVFDGIGRLHVQWFRDGIGKDNPTDRQLLVDSVTQVHRNGMKMLAIIGGQVSDFDQKDYLTPEVSGCQWGAYPLSKIKLGALKQRLVNQFEALKSAGLTIDAFELGNELDLYCNDADMPKTSEFAAHQWKWFLSDQQVQAFAKGYAPFIKTSVDVIRQYFPHAKIITCGMGNPTGNSAPLIAALANLKDSSGNPFDYTTLVDGYGSHLYAGADTTLDIVTRGNQELTAQAAVLPHIQEKPIWITEWNEAASAFWSSHKWYFQYTANGQPGGDLNRTDPQHKYPPMTRAQVIRTFESQVINHLRTQANPVNVGYLFYYSYDSAGKSSMCDNTGFNKKLGVKGVCFNGVINPNTGDLLPDVAAAFTAGH